MAAAINTDSPIQSDSSDYSSSCPSASSESEGELEYLDKKFVQSYTCCICHEIVDEFRELPCHHIGCWRCIRKWGRATYK